MIKKFYLEELDCANCAAKMERKINKVKGVNEATVNFMTKKLIIDFDETREEEIIKEALEAARKIDKTLTFEESF